MTEQRKLICRKCHKKEPAKGGTTCAPCARLLVGYIPLDQFMKQWVIDIKPAAGGGGCTGYSAYVCNQFSHFEEAVYTASRAEGLYLALKAVNEPTIQDAFHRITEGLDEIHNYILHIQIVES